MTFRQAQAAALALAAMVRSPTSGWRGQRRIEIVSLSPLVARACLAQQQRELHPKAETLIERKFAYGRVSKDLEDEDV